MNLKETLEMVGDAMRFVDLALGSQALDLTDDERSDEEVKHMLSILRYRVRILKGTLREVQQKGANNGTEI